MKKIISCIKGTGGALFAKLFLATILVATYSCSNETIEEEGLIETDNEISYGAKDAPVVGGVFVIQSLRSGRTLSVKDASNSNRANLETRAKNTNTKSTHRQWEIIATSNGYVRFKGVDSGKSIQTGNVTSNGSNVNIFAYDKKDWQEWKINSLGNNLYSIENRHSGKMLRALNNGNGSNVNVWAWKNWNTQKFYFHRVDGGSTTPPPSGGGGGTANSIIGGGWKLNGYSGNLNVGSSNNGLSYADDASKGESHFFFEKNGYAAFRTYPGNPTSGGSSNPRSELRELINGGSNYWNGNTNTEHSMKWRFRIEDLPPSGKLAFGQIHERDDKFDDVIRVQVQGNSGQNSGNVDLRILGYVTEEIEGSGKTIDFDMKMDTEYYFELAMKNGVVSLYNLNNSGNRTRTLFRSVDIGNADENYFKAGCYLQSTSSSDKNSNVYGQVLIKNLRVSPDN